MTKPNFGHFVGVLSLNASLAGLGVLMLPIAVGSLAASGVDARTLGVIAFMELGGAALTAIIASTRMSRADPLWLCIVGSLLVMVGNLGSAFALETVPLLVGLRPLVGIGTGLMHAAGLAVVARLRKPERMYGYIGMAPCFTAVIGFTLAPHLIELTGNAAGVFGFQGFVAVVNTLLLYTERRRVRAYIAHDRGEAAEIAVDAPTAAAPPLDARTTLLGAGAYFLLAFADAIVWAFVAPMAEVSGITLGQMSMVLIASAVVGSLGPFFAGRVGDRFGLLPPLLVGQAGMLGLSLVLVLTRHPGVYICALLARVFAILFLQPRYNGLFARLDPMGRLVAAAAGFAAIGYAIGPLVGGMVISLEQREFIQLGVIGACTAAMSLALTLVLVAGRRATLGRAAAPEAAANPA